MANSEITKRASTVGELRKAIKDLPDDMLLYDNGLGDPDDVGLMMVEQYQHPVRGWEDLAFQDDVEAQIRMNHDTRTLLSIQTANVG